MTDKAKVAKDLIDAISIETHRQSVITFYDRQPRLELEKRLQEVIRSIVEEKNADQSGQQEEIPEKLAGDSEVNIIPGGESARGVASVPDVPCGERVAAPGNRE